MYLRKIFDARLQLQFEWVRALGLDKNKKQIREYGECCL